MSENSYKYFENKECEYFPCHGEGCTNCLFCFCPIYGYEDCGGKFSILDNGLKDCSQCSIPHYPDGYDRIVKFLKTKLTSKFNSKN